MQCIPILDEIIFECTVCHTIIPEKCELSAEVGWKVKLKKKHSGTWRAIFNDKMVRKYVHLNNDYEWCLCTM